jgi:type IV secretory pathway VirB4 component
MNFLDFLKRGEAKKSTQAYLDIAEIKDSLVVMKNGSLRLIMLVSTVNFELKSEEEQNILIGQYQNFLNSLEFPIQIVIQSRRLDLSSYISKLKERLNQTENELLKLQIADYIEFIKELIAQANIMDKKAYVIVPYFPPLIKTPSSWEEVISGRPPKTLTASEFETFKKEVIQRAHTVASGLGSLGLRCIQLNTQELIELFYNIYNPEFATLEKLLPVEELKSPVVEKAEEEKA